MAWSSVTSERFTRADHSLAQYGDIDGKTCQTGATGTWTKRNGTLRMGTTDGYGGTVSAPRYEIASLTLGNDHKVEITAGTSIATYVIWLRHTNVGSGQLNASGYLCVMGDAGNWEVKRYDSGVFHSPTLGTAMAPGISAGDVIAAEIEGSVVVLRKNGTAIVTASSDTQHTTGGVAVGADSSTDDTMNFVEVFESGGGGGGSTPGDGAAIIMVL